MKEELGKRIMALEAKNYRLIEALNMIIYNDKSYYLHHEPREYDGRLPKEDGGTIWLTPREIARRAIKFNERPENPEHLAEGGE